MSLIVPAKYVDQMRARAARRAGTTELMPVGTPEANKAALSANLVALGRTKTPDEQRDTIFAMLGEEMRDVQPLGNRVLVATYVAPQAEMGEKIEKMPDGSELIAAYDDDAVRRGLEANRFEGKVGLVLAVGPTAFKYDGAWPWEGPKPKVGDWVWYRASDAPERGINNVYCRMIQDDLIEGITADPRLIR